jgi:hypothetical protein
MRRPNYQPLVIVASFALLGFCIWMAAAMLSQASVDQAAMENGYHQVLVDGELVWRKRPAETVAKLVKWLVEIAAELF